MSIKFILCMTLLLGGNSYALYAQTMSQDSLTIEALDSSYYQNTFNLDDTHFEIGQVYRPKPAIVFQYNSYEILEKSLPILDSIANFLKEHPRFVVEVGNHKDGRGGDAYSRKITPKRAKKVVETLISLGVDSAQLIWMGYGDSSPIIPMHTIENISSSHFQEKAHQKNIRTEFKIHASEPIESLAYDANLIKDSIIKKPAEEFLCILRADKSKYKVGELPKLTVKIINRSGKDVYLIPSLDGSESKLRMPYCIFDIDGPEPDSIVKRWFCGNVNSLRVVNFVEVGAGASFNPLNYWNSAIEDSLNFSKAGKYTITYRYSTNSADINKFLGHSKPTKEIEELFQKVPKKELISNSVELVFER